MACSALIIILIIVQSVSASASISHGLHDLTPAPYLHTKDQVVSRYQYLNQPSPIPYVHHKAPAPTLNHKGLTPAPYPQNNYQSPNPKYSQDWYKHVVAKDSQPYQNAAQPKAPEYTVYRNPYDVTGPREVNDAVRTQDEDVIVSLSFRTHISNYLPWNQ